MMAAIVCQERDPLPRDQLASTVAGCAVNRITSDSSCCLRRNQQREDANTACDGTKVLTCGQTAELVLSDLFKWRDDVGQGVAQLTEREVLFRFT